MPKRFVFRLQPVLDLRQRDEERCQLKVAELERERARCEQTLRDIQHELLETRRAMRRGLHPEAAEASEAAGPEGDPVQPPVGGMGGVRLLAGASLHLAVRAQRSVLELAGIHKRLESARADLIRATAARKAVQLLKDRALEEHRRAAAKREHADLDELVVMRHGRGEPVQTPRDSGHAGGEQP